MISARTREKLTDICQLSLLGIIAVLVVSSLIYLIITFTQKEKESGEYEELADNYVKIDAKADAAPRSRGESEEEPLSRGTEARLSVDYDALREINDEIVGWLYIEGTGISYPVAQTTDNSYYLDRTFAKEKSKLGTIFLDTDLSIGTSETLILYGHNMGAGRTEMFSPLTDYDDESYLAGHSGVIMSTAGGGESLWEIFAVLHINAVRDGAVMYRKQGFGSDGQYNDYIRLIKSNGLFESGITPRPGQRILMLSTCLGAGQNDMRRVVFAAEVIALP